MSDNPRIPFCISPIAPFAPIDAAFAGAANNAGAGGMADRARLESARVAALRSYNLLDSPAEAIFDEITELVAQICEVPLALINLVDADRQWFKSVHRGPGLNGPAGHVSFCDCVVGHAQPLEVADATHDVRFHKDPPVAAAPRIRFYAGMPLMTESGHAIGTLCVMDTRPRSLTRSQRTALSQLTNVVMRLFDARRHERDAVRLGHILEHSLNEIVIFDAETSRVLHANQGACRNLGYSLDELKNLTGDMLALDWTDTRRRQVQGALMRGETQFLTIEIEARRKNGSSYPVEARVQTTGQYGRPGFVVIGNDISARKSAEEALHREKELAQITLESIGDAMITTDAAGQVTYLNPVAERLTGWGRAEAVGRPLERVFHIVADRDRQRVASPVDRVLRDGKITGLADNTVLLARDGREYSVEDSAAPIRARDGTLAGVVLVFRDVTEARELASNLSWQASHDALTELVNRREFENVLGGLLHSAKARNLQHALLYLDLDQFKIVNDSCGHQAGDELLKRLSAMLLSRMRKADTLARLGGDEFGVLLDGCGVGQATTIAQQLLDAIRVFRFTWDGRLFSVSASIGVMEVNRHSENIEQVMSGADTACFMAKDKGRNQIQVFRLEDEEVSSRHGEVSWASRLLQSVEENRFFLAFQHVQRLGRSAPAVGGISPELEYVEVLLRMKDEQGRTIPPMTFIPAAERYQLMPTIDRWVIERTMHCIARRTGTGATGREASLCRRTRFAVNLSGLSLSDEHFLDFILDRFDATGVSPSQLCFEITETAAISNLSRVARFMQRLQAMGCRFALDDFGSGLSSFAYLKNLPVDYLKIDGMFVKGAATDSIDFAMVESINRVGHVMGMRTIAEFVENEDILQCMRDIGVDFVQGHHLHQPESFPALAARQSVAATMECEAMAC
ncbi:MAG: EAL domain-containing protein [Betaproteobacteria bacterium]